MGANSKKKGNNGEREFLRLLHARGIEAMRNDQTFVGGQGKPDVGAQIGDRQFHFEVKRTEKFRLYDAIAQAQRDAECDSVPVVAHRSNRHQWVCVLTLEDFLQIVGVEPVYSDPTPEDDERLKAMMQEWDKESAQMLEEMDLEKLWYHDI